MKVARTYTIDEELVRMLYKEDNASELINSLLIKYFEKHGKTEKEILDDVKKRMIQGEEIDKAKTKADQETDKLREVINNELQSTRTVEDTGSMAEEVH